MVLGGVGVNAASAGEILSDFHLVSSFLSAKYACMRAHTYIHAHTYMHE